jgi:hypothetical protein
MKVPDEWVDAALEVAGRAGGMAEPYERARYTKALEAVLPKVRERLEALAGHPDGSGTNRVITVQEAIDAAFPEEESGEC